MIQFILTATLLIYFMGFAISSLRLLHLVQLLKKHHPALCVSTKKYFISHILFWPIYFLARNSPLSLLSKLFFRSYGHQNIIHSHDQGIKYFFNDIFKGKNRYLGCTPNTMIIPLDKTSKIYDRHKELLGKTQQNLVATIIFAKHQDHYLLSVCISDSKIAECNFNTVTRYHLDDCQRLSAEKFKERLFEINNESALKICESLGIQI